jgi:hypothetical protein
MNIQPLKSEGVTPPPKQKGPAARATAASGTEDAPKAGKHEKLIGALASEPAVRPEEIARGKALAADAGYPSDDVLARLAELFVNDASRRK